MSVPKKRHTSGRGKRRRAHDALKSPNLITCSNCKKPARSHRACPHCGYYNGKQMVRIKKVKSKT